VQLVSKISSLCGPDPPTSQTDGQTDDMRLQDCALHYSASCGKNWLINQQSKVCYLAVGGRWLDKLGVAARMGIDVVVRQSFFRGNYALIDKYMHPRPVRSLCILYWYTFISVFFAACQYALLDTS